MTATEAKWQIGGNYMPLAVDLQRAALLAEGAKCFSPKPIPRFEELIQTSRIGTYEIQKFLAGRSWSEVATSELFQGGRNDAIDLGDIPRGLSRSGLRYYLPGLVLHFLKNGTYEDSIWGPTFYFNFVRRLQHDNKDVLEFGGASKYFNLSDEQHRFCANALSALFDKYGDTYGDFNERGYEWQSAAHDSIRRALAGFWSKSE